MNGEKKNNKLFKKIKSINKKITIFFGSYVVTNLKYLDRNKNYIMLCGIGNPHEFENTLLKYKFNITNKFIYPDHYKIPNLKINNIKNIARKEKSKIITTEKDYFRLSKNQRKGIKILKTKLKIKNLNKLKKILSNIHEKI